MAKQEYRTCTVDGVEYTYPTEGTKKGRYATFEEWDRCCLCGMNYPKSRFEYYGGQPYCVVNGCNKDISQLIRRKS